MVVSLLVSFTYGFEDSLRMNLKCTPDRLYMNVRQLKSPPPYD